MRSFCRFLLLDRPPKRSDVRGSDELIQNAVFKVLPVFDREAKHTESTRS
jgi:hypothetical protein